MSPEASLAIPIFMLFLMTILLGVEMVRLQTNVFEALHQGISAAMESRTDDVAAGTAVEYMNLKEYPYLCVEGGNTGLKFHTESDIENSGTIEFSADYGIKPFIRTIPIGHIKIEDAVFAHFFTGYIKSPANSEEKEASEYVYVTKSGTKYHRLSDCTHIKVCSYPIKIEKLGEKRNGNGGKYYPCEICHPDGTETVYITDTGDRYHSSAACPALRRTVFVIQLKEALKNGYTPCSKCA